MGVRKLIEFVDNHTWKKNMLPIEVIDIVLGFGFPWFISVFRLLNKEMKTRIDLILSDMCKTYQHKKQQAGHWQSHFYTVAINVEDRNRMFMLAIITQTSNMVSTKERITNKQCVEVYNTVFYICSMYGLQKLLYTKMEAIFDKTFASCQKQGVFCEQSAKYCRRFYRCVFCCMVHYTNYYNKEDVDTILDKKIEFWRHFYKEPLNSS